MTCLGPQSDVHLAPGGLPAWLQRLDGTSRFLAMALLLSLTSIWILFAIIVHASYTEQRKDASEYAGNVAALIAADLSNIFEAYDLSLQALVEDLENPAIRQLPDAIRPKVLFDNSTNASIFGAMVVVDENGIIIEDSRHSVMHHIDVSDRDYFKVMKDDPPSRVFLSKPYSSRITDEEMVGISRRLDRNGQFAGVALGTVRLSALRNLFAKAHLPPGSIIALRYPDGSELTSLTLPKADAHGRAINPASLTARVGASPTFSGSTPRSLVVSRPIVGLPLVQTVSIPMSAILATFWQRTLAIAAGFTLLSGIIITLGVTLMRELIRRAAAEAALRQLATTDGLTGLTNRRRFDELLCGEVERSQRTNQPLALLVLDVDYFKAFNDTYGHSGGDAALRAVADVLSAQPVRQSDVVARLGGEEFGVLMPDTDLAGAGQLAARIQAAMRVAALPHAGSPLGILTISIGFASHPASSIDTFPETLFEEADAALYRAKRDGRNTTQGPISRDNHSDASVAA